ncbi:MAG: ATP-binding cassette domain-containing protein [Aquisalimonadaceae bacterium]
MEAILSATDIKKRFFGISVLNGVSLQVPRGRVTALVGSNGAGKSTLLNLISGLLTADEGAIFLDGQDVTNLPAHTRARSGLARSFQHPRSFRSLTVLDSVLLGSVPASQETLPQGLMAALRGKPVAESERVAAAKRVLERCRLDHRIDTPAADLTYGERKLLMLAQILAFDGKLFCFDELCAGLEQDVIDHVGGIFRQLADDGKSVLFIEHNLQLVRDLADHVIFLNTGTVFREGDSAAVLEDPEVVRLYLGQ